MVVIPATLSSLPSMAYNMTSQYPGVVVFDNGSDPRIELPQVLVRFEENLRFVKGWNRAMAIIQDMEPKTEAVWMMNDDITGACGWMLERLYSAMRLQPRAAVITPVFNSPHETFHHFRGNDYGLRRVSWIDWCVPLVSIEAWKDVGPFDEQFVGYGADIDWCKRARDRGWEFYVHEGCSIHHMGSVTTEALGANEMRDVFGMNEKLKAKWGVSSFWELMI